MMDFGWACCGGLFAIYENKAMMLYTLNVYADIYDFPKKLGRGRTLGCLDWGGENKGEYDNDL